MKRIACIMITLLMTAGMVMAQGGPRDRNVDPKTRAERMTEQMTKELSLNDVQKQQVYDLNLEMANKMPQRRSQDQQPSQEDRDKMRAEMTKVRDEYNTKIKEVLTKEQYDIYVKNQSERQGRQGGGRR